MWSVRHMRRATVAPARRGGRKCRFATGGDGAAQSIADAIRVAFAMRVKVRFFAGSQGNPAPSTT